MSCVVKSLLISVVSVVCMVWDTVQRSSISFLVIAGLLGGAQPILAKTLTVGSCPGATFTKISDAVSAASPSDNVNVCPGTYPEQVTISTPLTLRGIPSGNSDRVVIAVPAGGLAFNAIGNTVATQVLVTTGPVTITDITVDGTGNNFNAPLPLAGIVYDSGSSGTVRRVTIRQQMDHGGGFGIWADNATTTPELVTIEKCDIHDVDNTGIRLGNFPTLTLTATVKGNRIAGAPTGIFDAAAGSVTDNVITEAGNNAIRVFSPATVSVTGNTITDSRVGIEVDSFSGSTVQSNVIFNSSLAGISLFVSTTVESNSIDTAGRAGISFNCIAGSTVSDNTISDTFIGADEVLSSQIVSNTYHNVDIIRNELDCSP